MLSLLKEDLKIKALFYYQKDDFLSKMHILIVDGTVEMILYRLMQFCQKKILLWPFASLICRLNNFFNRTLIGRGADFGPGFVILHGCGIVINGAVKGGKNIILEHQVTIGRDKGKVPLLGNNIYIGAGAKIIGGIKIGNDVKIGANAVVVKDVPDNVTVVGVPARVVKLNNQKV